MFPAFWTKVFFLSSIFFGVILLETGSFSLHKNDSRMNPVTALVNREPMRVVDPVFQFLSSVIQPPSRFPTGC